MNFEKARMNMVESQLRPNKVSDVLVLERFAAVPREKFVDHSCQLMAYADEPLAIGYGRTVMAPMVCGRILQDLDLESADSVLVLAGGTGYSALLIAPLVEHVTVVEENPYLLDIARKNMLDLNIRNIKLLEGKPEDGLPKKQFDKILIDAPTGEVPAGLFEQLKDGGLLGTVTKNADGLLEATVYSKNGKTIFEQPLLETKGEILANFAIQERFVF